MNSLFPVPFQQSSYLEWPWVCSCHLPQAAWLMKESFVLLISDTLCAAQVPRTKSVEHTMNLSPASFKRNKRKTSFTWNVFLSVKLLLPILKKNIILSIFKSLFYSLLLPHSPPHSGTKATGTEGLFLSFY